MRLIDKYIKRGAEMAEETDIKVPNSDEMAEKEITDNEAAHNPDEKQVAETIAGLIEKNQQLEAEAKKNYDLYLRALAEMDNYRKRAAKDKEEYILYANQSILKKLLGIVDDLERAMSVESEGNQDYDSLKKGLDLINRNVADLLKNENVVEIEALGKEFDPQVHQPLMMEPNSDYPEHTVLQVFQKGYMYKGKALLRPSLVKVSEK